MATKKQNVKIESWKSWVSGFMIIAGMYIALGVSIFNVPTYVGSIIMVFGIAWLIDARVQEMKAKNKI